jgi:hypothetical protein
MPSPFSLPYDRTAKSYARASVDGSLLGGASFEDLPGKWQAAVLKAEQNRPQFRVVSGD